MRQARFILPIVIILILGGCAKDPKAKLDEADELRENNDAIGAERLIREVIEQYSERDDLSGLGYAYAHYGLLLVSDEYRARKDHWQRQGTYDATLSSGIGYLEKATKNFARAADPVGGRFATFQLAQLYADADRTADACQALDAATALDAEAIRRFPHASYMLPRGYRNLGEVAASRKAEYACPEQMEAPEAVGQ